MFRRGAHPQAPLQGCVPSIFQGLAPQEYRLTKLSCSRTFSPSGDERTSPPHKLPGGTDSDHRTVCRDKARYRTVRLGTTHGD